MSDEKPISLLNPAVMEIWNSNAPKSTIKIEFSKQEWDLILNSMVGNQIAIESLYGLLLTLGNELGSSKSKQHLEFEKISQDLKIRTARLIETIMMKGWASTQVVKL